MIPFAVAGLGAAVVSWLITALARRYAMAKLMLDIPNERSSHTRPTPRGGGLGIAIVVLIGIALAGAVRWIPFRTAVGLEGGVLAVTIIPHTYRNTTLGAYQPGSRVNIECDILAKHVEKLIRKLELKPRLTVERLRDEGY